MLQLLQNFRLQEKYPVFHFDGSTDITLTAAHVAAFRKKGNCAMLMVACRGMPESGAYNVTSSGDSYILPTFIPVRKLPDPADEGALQKWRSVLPFLKRWLWF